MDRRVQLKVKIKSLAEEAKIITFEKNKLKVRASHMAHTWPEDAKELRNQITHLMHHKDCIVGSEARYSLLAYAILRGKPYCVVEQKCREGNKPYFKRIIDLAKRFGADKEEISNWVDEAKKHLGIYVAPIAPKPEAVKKPGLVRAIVNSVIYT